LPRNIKLEESVICLNHYWLCENRHVNEKVMQSLVKDVRGTRTYGSAALEFAHVAEGVIGAYLTMRLEPWDMAEGKIIKNKVGGVTTNIDGEECGTLKRTSNLT